MQGERPAGCAHTRTQWQMGPWCVRHPRAKHPRPHTRCQQYSNRAHATLLAGSTCGGRRHAHAATHKAIATTWPHWGSRVPCLPLWTPWARARQEGNAGRPGFYEEPGVSTPTVLCKTPAWTSWCPTAPPRVPPPSHPALPPLPSHQWLRVNGWPRALPDRVRTNPAALARRRRNCAGSLPRCSSSL